MSGVIDEDGTQWEHCNVCAGWVRIEELHYEPPSQKFDCGRDVGPCCWDPATGRASQRADRIEQIKRHMRTAQIKEDMAALKEAGVKPRTPEEIANEKCQAAGLPTPFPEAQS